MKNKTKKLISSKTELLAPAGNLEKLKFALEYGADAVYAGIPDFSLRVRINDFTLESLSEAADYCHQRNKKIYVTVNILAHNKHLEILPKYIKKLKHIGVDALIASDPGVVEVIKKYWPKCEIHLSTQANCTNWQAAEFWYKQGVKRIIIGREVTLPEIKEIKKKLPKLELEYFVHGAMCLSYSGRCFLSKYYVGKSANLGDCVQPCRWEHEVHTRNKQNENELNEIFINEVKRPNNKLELVEDRHGSYILNSKDLNLIKYLDKLIEAGVDSFKIEGRAKSVYYQGVVVGAYRKAIDLNKNKKINKINKSLNINKLSRELEDKLVHRGYTTGFLLNEKADENTEKSHEVCEWEFCGATIVPPLTKGVGGISQPKRKNKIYIKVHNQIRVGDQLEILTPKYDIIKKKVTKIFDENKQMYLESAHGGQKTIVGMQINRDIPGMSLVRRKVLLNKLNMKNKKNKNIK